MLVEARIAVTLEELEAIVLEFIKKGTRHADNIHKYVQYLSFVKSYALPSKVWKEYLSGILLFASDIINGDLPESENLEDAINCAIDIFTEVYRNTCTTNEVELLTPEFKEILQCTFASLATFTTDIISETERENKRACVVRPFLLCIIKNNISLAELLEAESFTEFFVSELACWGLKNPDFFQGLFPKISKEGFSTGKIPWSVFKGIKDELHNAEKKDLYFFVTKYFFDNYEDKEEICNYVFTIDEYKELVKYFLSKKGDPNEDPIQMNDDNEAEYDGFLIV